VDVGELGAANCTRVHSARHPCIRSAAKRWPNAADVVVEDMRVVRLAPNG